MIASKVIHFFAWNLAVKLLKTKICVISYFFSLEALPQQEDEGPESKRRTGIENDIKPKIPKRASLLGRVLAIKYSL